MECIIELYYICPIKTKQMTLTKKLKAGTVVKSMISGLLTIVEVSEHSVKYKSEVSDTIFTSKKWKALQWVSDGQWTIQ